MRASRRGNARRAARRSRRSVAGLVQRRSVASTRCASPSFTSDGGNEVSITRRDSSRRQSNRQGAVCHRRWALLCRAHVRVGVTRGRRAACHSRYIDRRATAVRDRSRASAGREFATTTIGTRIAPRGRILYREALTQARAECPKGHAAAPAWPQQEGERKDTRVESVQECSRKVLAIPRGRVYIVARIYTWGNILAVGTIRVSVSTSYGLSQRREGT